jgi:hypothetical protein
VPAPATEAERAWAVIQDTTRLAVLEDFIRQFGNTVYGSLARARLEELKKSQSAAAAPPVRPAIDPLSCSEERTAKSIEGNRATSIRFRNHRRSTVRIFWLDYEGRRKFYKELPPGQQYLQPTYMTHPWIITDQVDRCVAFYMPEVTERLVDIR